MHTPAFLIVRLAAIGDVVLTTPLLGRIRAEHPDAHVTWMCGSRVSALVRLLPGVDEIIEVDEHALLRGNAFARAAAMGRAWRQLAGRSFDRVLLLHPDPRYRVLLWPVGRSRIHVLEHPPGRRTNPVPGRFRGDEAARLLDGNASCGPIVRQWALADLRDRVPASAAGRRSRPRVVLVPGGARNVLREDALRRWPVESYTVLARRLVDAGIEVVLVGDAADREQGSRFVGIGVQDRIGATSLPELLGVMRDADVIVSHDTGPMHLARLVRTPLVALFGPTDPAQFIGDDPLVTVLWGGRDLACRPCYDGRSFADCSDNICISRVPVDHVLEAVKGRLAGGTSGVAAEAPATPRAAP